MKLILITLSLLMVLSRLSVNARVLRRSCGKYLADRISDLCKARGGYNQLSSADIRFPAHNRSKRGVVEECCKQSCTDYTLMQYCLDQVEEHEETVINIENLKITTTTSTERSLKRHKFTTRFPIQTLPMEIGTVRPEFNNINAKYMGNRRKQYYYY